MNNNEETALVRRGDHVKATALTPAGIDMAQGSILEWARSEYVKERVERDTIKESLRIAKASKWRWRPIEAQLNRSKERVTFLDKLVRALEAGFHIIPNFPDEAV